MCDQQPAAVVSQLKEEEKEPKMLKNCRQCKVHEMLAHRTEEQDHLLRSRDGKLLLHSVVCKVLLVAQVKMSH